ncbi:MAG TPA: M20/M25/M40 family metallo-hydrolase [Gaiellaceae bacterium]|jgi:tripeptide aminopeptidase|nr:M20/M25/M40 family metallo-hydrolase [Gaiellaceae bacterium]
MAVPDLVTLFCELAAIPSPPGEERAVADRVADYLREIGLDVQEDGAGPEVGSTAGNLLARAAPTDGGMPIFLCAHLDTVPPTAAVEPVVEEGIVRNARPTILGADNKAAVAVMLESVRRTLEERRPHGGIELVFTPKEEVGLVGAKAFDAERLEARLGYVFDHEGPIGQIVRQAPSSTAIDAVFTGRAAHAGMAPEDGRSAIYAAARAVADLRLGRVDDDSTANVGEIHGGTARNIVPERCTVVAEARSQDDRKLAELVQEMVDSFAFAASVAECEVETALEEKYRGYRLGRDEPAVRLAEEALRRAGFEPELVVGGGGADANVFNLRGRPCVNLANGMARIHSAEEHIAVRDLERMVDVTLALVDAARGA